MWLLGAPIRGKGGGLTFSQIRLLGGGGGGCPRISPNTTTGGGGGSRLAKYGLHADVSQNQGPLMR